jgi:nitroreductase
MQTFYDLIRSRYSVKSYSEKSIESDVFSQIFDAACVSPLINNMNSQRIRIMTNDEFKKVSMNYNNITGAFVPLLFCYDGSATNKEYSNNYISRLETGIPQSQGYAEAYISAANAMNCAFEFGIISNWVYKFDKILIRKILNLPRRYYPAVILTLGYPKENISVERNKSISVDTLILGNAEHKYFHLSSIGNYMSVGTFGEDFYALDYIYNGRNDSAFFPITKEEHDNPHKWWRLSPLLKDENRETIVFNGWTVTDTPKTIEIIKRGALNVKHDAYGDYYDVNLE